MNEEKTKSNRRVLKIIELLAGKEFDGLRPVELQKALGTSPATITRDLQDMEEEGFVERVPGREEAWRLAPKCIQIFRAHAHGMDRVRHRLEETEQRYSRVR